MEFFSVIETGCDSITVSIVSHGQGSLVAELLKDLVNCNVAEIILTQNISEGEIACPESLRSRVRLIQNKQPKGFAANHNYAYLQSRTSVFAILNPDIRLDRDPFPMLKPVLDKPDVGLVVPIVLNPQGKIEDSVRYFPTIPKLVAKLLRLSDGRISEDWKVPSDVEWAAGMFMMFRSDAFKCVDGFDESFFLYYEDVDICVRMWKAGLRVVLDPRVTVIHAAQRASRTNLKYTAWHLSSMARYFYKHFLRLPRVINK